MSTLHTALQSLSPTSFSAVPTSQSEATAYLQNAFSDAQTIIDSVPLPPPTDPISPPRPRASTGASTASNVSEISSSSARSEPLHSSHLSLQKEWGKPIKLNAKDNPLGMAVYKVGGKDGRGAWFARRSVHEGLGFRKWKLGLQREFPETLTVQGGPGEGNIRGIGGERRVERIGIDGVGTIEVYHLSAQFPGPTTPRDFVTLLLTSSSALNGSSSLRPSSPASDGGKPASSRFGDSPKHFMVISRPCEHPDCPPRDGFIRGNYESVEFIREIPVKPKKSASTTDLMKHGRSEGHAMEEEALLRNANHKAANAEESLPAPNNLSPSAAEDGVGEGRARGKTISFAGSRGSSAKGEKLDTPQEDDDDDGSNPVEWIMITRSDPGGSVPRFMVERGTPGSIVADAGKFLDWACKKEHPEDEVEALEKGDTARMGVKRRESLEPYRTNGRLAGLDGASDAEDTIPSAPTEKAQGKSNADPVQEVKPGSLLSSATNAAYAGLEAYAPRAVLERLPGHQQSSSISASVASFANANGNGNGNGAKSTEQTPSLSSASSVASFASAEDYFEDTQSLKSALSTTKSASAKDQEAMSPHEKELAKLNDRKRQLNEKLNKAREKETKDKEELTSKEEERIRKAEEKHSREIAKQEEKYKREVAKLAAKRQKEAAKEEDRKRKAEDKDEKSKLSREKEEVRAELEVVSKERDILRDQVGALQKENTALVAQLGKMEEGREVLREVKTEVEANRSSSGGVRKGKGKGNEATVLGGEMKKENLPETAAL